MTLDDELKRLDLLGDAEKAFNAKLDEIENDSRPRIFRYVSTRPKEGYYWNSIDMLYHEGDDLFRVRIKAAIAGRD